MVWSACREWERPRLFFFHFGARRDGGARRVPRPGPGAVRPLLRPDAGAVLLPDRRSGARATASPATTKIVIYTLVGSLLMLAGGGRHGVLRAPHGGHDLRSSFADLAPDAAARAARRTGSSSASPLAFLVKMPAFPFHGWMPDAYRAMPLPVLAVLLGGAVEGRRLRLPADRAAALPGRAAHFQDADAADRAGLDPLRLGDGVHADERAAGRSATRRSRSSASSRSGSSRSTTDGRPGRAAADGQPRPRGRRRCSSSSRCSPRAPAARRTSATWAASRSARRCSPRCS